MTIHTSHCLRPIAGTVLGISLHTVSSIDQPAVPGAGAGAGTGSVGGGSVGGGSIGGGSEGVGPAGGGLFGAAVVWLESSGPVDSLSVPPAAFCTVDSSAATAYETKSAVKKINISPSFLPLTGRHVWHINQSTIKTVIK